MTKVHVIKYQVTFDVSLVTKAYCHQYDFVTTCYQLRQKLFDFVLNRISIPFGNI